MPKVFIYSDPHLGLSRKAHYTETSSRAREAWVTNELFELLNDSKNAGHDFRLCLGDFYERESVSERVLLDSLPIAELTDIILAGNHDLSNRLGKATSFEVLREVVGEDTVLMFSTSRVIGNTLFCFAPHVLTQELYEEAIENLRVEASQFNGYRVLCLHCNWDMDPERISEGTLNLTPELACALLRDFHTILVGHVHTQQEIYGGRLKLIGSVYPTAFDNLESKQALLYDTETGEFEDITTWSVDRGYVGPASDVDDLLGPIKQYYDLTDDLPAGESQKLAVDLFRAGTFGVRLRKPDGGEAEELEISTEQFHRLPQVIGEELAKERPHLVPLWEELTRSPVVC
jgi:DNA repair exonuclease SbcCD nuclease subunit